MTDESITGFGDKATQFELLLASDYSHQVSLEYCQPNMMPHGHMMVTFNNVTIVLFACCYLNNNNNNNNTERLL